MRWDLRIASEHQDIEVKIVGSCKTATQPEGPTTSLPTPPIPMERVFVLGCFEGGSQTIEVDGTGRSCGTQFGEHGLEVCAVVFRVCAIKQRTQSAFQQSG
jgi:hypothetical protein